MACNNSHKYCSRLFIFWRQLRSKFHCGVICEKKTKKTEMVKRRSLSTSFVSFLPLFTFAYSMPKRKVSVSVSYRFSFYFCICAHVHACAFLTYSLHSGAYNLLPLQWACHPVEDSDSSVSDCSCLRSLLFCSGSLCDFQRRHQWTGSPHF